MAQRYVIALSEEELMFLEEEMRNHVKISKYFRDEAHDVTISERNEADRKVKLGESILEKLDTSIRPK